MEMLEVKKSVNPIKLLKVSPTHSPIMGCRLAAKSKNLDTVIICLHKIYLIVKISTHRETNNESQSVKQIKAEEKLNKPA